MNKLSLRWGLESCSLINLLPISAGIISFTWESTLRKKQTKRCDIFQNTRKRRQWVLILWFLDGSSAAIAMKLQRKWKKEVQKKVRLMMRMLIMAMSKSLIKWELDYVWFTSFKVSWITKNSNQNSPGEIREKLRKTERNSCRYYGNLKP